MKSYQMNSGSGNKRSQATEKIKRIKDDMSDSITIGCFQFINDLTAHTSRLDRPMREKKRSKAYAFEEPVAEISASFICCHLGFEYSTMHSSYVKTWLEVLKEDKKAIFKKASSQAQKATEFILGNIPKLEPEVS